MREVVICLEQLSSAQKEIAKVIGLDSYLKLAKYCGGSNGIYIPKYSRLAKPSRDMEIMDKFNGYNYAELATAYNLSVRTIYKLVSSHIRQQKNAALEDQTKLF